jgi:hypothetical protein
MGPKGRPDTKTNWSTVRRPQDELQLQDRLCGLVVRVPGYRTEMYCVSCELRTELYICYVEESRPPLWSSGQSSWLQNRDVLCFLGGTK